MSSLDQLVKMGVLDADFLKLGKDGVQVQGQGSQQTTQTDPTVEYVSRTPQQLDQQMKQSVGVVECTHQEMQDYAAATRPQPQAPDDLKYYQDVKYHWLYSSPSYGWWHFTKDDNELLEAEYRKGAKQCVISVGYNSFTVDFGQMLQKGGGKPRHILRSPTLGDIVLKGVAGSRIIKRDILVNSVDQSHFGISNSNDNDETISETSEPTSDEQRDTAKAPEYEL